MLIIKMKLVNSKNIYLIMNMLQKLPCPMNAFNVENKIFAFKDCKNILIIFGDLAIITNVLSAMISSNLTKTIK